MPYLSAAIPKFLFVARKILEAQTARAQKVITAPTLSPLVDPKFQGLGPHNINLSILHETLHKEEEPALQLQGLKMHDHFEYQHPEDKQVDEVLQAIGTTYPGASNLRPSKISKEILKSDIKNHSMSKVAKDLLKADIDQLEKSKLESGSGPVGEKD